MASKRYAEITGYSDEELSAELKKLGKEYEQMRFDNYVKGLDNASNIRNTRRDVARLKTELRKREIESGGGELNRIRRISRRQRKAITK